MFLSMKNLCSPLLSTIYRWIIASVIFVAVLVKIKFSNGWRQLYSCLLRVMMLLREIGVWNARDRRVSCACQFYYGLVVNLQLSLIENENLQLALVYSLCCYRCYCWKYQSTPDGATNRNNIQTRLMSPPSSKERLYPRSLCKLL